MAHNSGTVQIPDIICGSVDALHTSSIVFPFPMSIFQCLIIRRTSSRDVKAGVATKAGHGGQEEWCCLGLLWGLYWLTPFLCMHVSRDCLFCRTGLKSS